MSELEQIGKNIKKVADAISGGDTKKELDKMAKQMHETSKLAINVMRTNHDLAVDAMLDHQLTYDELCEKEERFAGLVRYSNIPIITHMKTRLFTFLPGKGTQKAYDAALKYVGVRDGVPLREHHFITFGGEPGRGKTHLALGIGWHWLEVNLKTVIYYQVPTLLDAMRAEYDNPPKDSYGMPLKHIWERCQVADLLILDDLGMEKSTEWAVEKLDMIIDHRWLSELPTVFTTNKLLSQLPMRQRSRLENGVTALCEGPDYRVLQAQERRARNNSGTIAKGGNDANNT